MGNFVKLIYAIIIQCGLYNVVYNEQLASRIIHKIIRSTDIDTETFSTPDWPLNYPQNTRCLFIFIGNPDQQIKIQFHHFNVEGLSTICKKDYLDIYPNLESLPSDLFNISNFLFHAPVLGRFCGHNLEYIPNIIVSENNLLILDFFSDINTQKSYNQDKHMGSLGFTGNFTFIKNYMKMNYETTNSESSCYFTILSNKTKQGTIQSPNFPGLPIFPLKCTYEFKSNNPSDRIRLYFTQFHLFEMFNSCPLEHLEIFDEDLSYSITSHNSLLEKTCGIKKPFQVVSSSSRLFMVFSVLGDRNFLNQPHYMKKYKFSLLSRGFQLKFEFSSDFIKFSDGSVPGTECDKYIKSLPNKSGKLTISSSFLTTAHKRNITCNFYFMGLHNSQIMEIVAFNFTYINLPSITFDVCSGPSITFISSTFKMQDIVKRQRQILLEKERSRKEICGVRKEYFYRSKSPVTILQLKIAPFVENKIIPVGFQVNYQFIKDYGISGGLITPGKCHYAYRSFHKTGVTGLINSPFYNNFYPNNANCQYDIIAEDDEMIRILFIDFQTSEEVSPKLTNYHEVHKSCRQDYLSISEIVRHENQKYIINVTERYCGDSLPGLLVSQRNSIGFTLTFKSDAEKTGPGFLAEYQFIKKRGVFTDSCGKNISLLDNSGEISSPMYPKKYPSNLICEWHLSSPNSKDKVILLFKEFKIEGSAKSCSSAVLRIYEGTNVKAQLELCGTDATITSYVSKSNFIRIRFLTDKSSSGAEGFKILWTRSIARLQNGSCPVGDFSCRDSAHCIDRNLTCNNQFNCGSYINMSGSYTLDRSDEIDACPIQPDLRHLYVGLGIVAIIFIFLFLIIMFLHHKNKHLMKKKIPLKSTTNNSLSSSHHQIATNNPYQYEDRLQQFESEIDNTLSLDQHKLHNLSPKECLLHNSMLNAQQHINLHSNQQQQHQKKLKQKNQKLNSNNSWDDNSNLLFTPTILMSPSTASAICLNDYQQHKQTSYPLLQNVIINNNNNNNNNSSIECKSPSNFYSTSLSIPIFSSGPPSTCCASHFQYPTSIQHQYNHPHHHHHHSIIKNTHNITLDSNGANDIDDDIDDDDGGGGRGNMFSGVHKSIIIQPTIFTEHPASLDPFDILDQSQCCMSDQNSSQDNIDFGCLTREKLQKISMV